MPAGPIEAGAGHGRYQRAAGREFFCRFLDRQFELTENGTTVRTEFVAGVTTFLTMVYIVFVNPEILANAGMDRGAVFVATCLAAAVSTLIMALYANYPIALARHGAQAFFAFTLVLGYKYTWQQALAFVVRASACMAARDIITSTQTEARGSQAGMFRASPHEQDRRRASSRWRNTGGRCPRKSYFFLRWQRMLSLFLRAHPAAALPAIPSLRPALLGLRRTRSSRRCRRRFRPATSPQLEIAGRRQRRNALARALRHAPFERGAHRARRHMREDVKAALALDALHGRRSARPALAASAAVARRRRRQQSRVAPARSRRAAQPRSSS